MPLALLKVILDILNILVNDLVRIKTDERHYAQLERPSILSLIFPALQICDPSNHFVKQFASSLTRKLGNIMSIYWFVYCTVSSRVLFYIAYLEVEVDFTRFFIPR